MTDDRRERAIEAVSMAMSDYALRVVEVVAWPELAKRSIEAYEREMDRSLEAIAFWAEQAQSLYDRVAALAEENRSLRTYVREAAGDESVLLPVSTVAMFDESATHKLRLECGELRTRAEMAERQIARLSARSSEGVTDEVADRAIAAFAAHQPPPEERYRMRAKLRAALEAVWLRPLLTEDEAREVLFALDHVKSHTIELGRHWDLVESAREEIEGLLDTRGLEQGDDS